MTAVAPGADRGSEYVPDPEEPAKPDAFRTQPFAVELQTGLGAPLGIVGIALDYAPIPALALNAGVGVDASGVQWAGGARVRVFRFANRRHTSHFAIVCGAGIAGGAFDTQRQLPLFGSLDDAPGGGENPTPHYHFDQALWVTTDLGFEMRFGPHFMFRPAIGLAKLLNPGAGTPIHGQLGETPDPVDDSVSPYLALNLGYVVSSSLF
ncbi:MAG TPA: hypothetical protein VHV30_05990 [Polyangiaceae bacterium]|nr:hypothetical protein [Polyangiaceae bacterium]